MTDDSILKVRIKQDIKDAYSPDERIEAFAFLYRTENKEEYAHFLRAYNISEEYFKNIIFELRNPGKVKS